MLRILLAIILFSSFGFAQSGVKCLSNQKAHAYYADQGQWLIKFDFGLSDEQITNVYMKNKQHAVLGFTNEAKIEIDRTFKAKNPQYKDYNRYLAGDEWCTYNILLPKGLNEIEDSFQGIVYSACEAGDHGTFTIFCNK